MRCLSLRFQNNLALLSPSLMTSFSSLSISNCSFAYQSSDQGSFILDQQSSNITVLNTVFRFGSATSKGGAISCIKQCNLTLSNTVFSECTSGSKGGAIYAYNSYLAMSYGNISRTSASLVGGAIYLDHGSGQITYSSFTQIINGAIIGISSNSVLITNSIFTFGTNLVGGFLYCYFCSYVKVMNSTFDSGNASTGGAVVAEIDSYSNSKYECVISGNHFANNNAVTSGGAVSLQSLNCTIINNTFQSNMVQSGNGGGLSLDCLYETLCDLNVVNNLFASNSAEISGGAIFWQSSKPQLENNTFQNNSAFYGDEIASYATYLAVVNNSTPLAFLNSEDPPLALNLYEVASGQVIHSELSFGLFDDQSNLVLTSNGLIAEMVAVNSSSLEGRREYEIYQCKWDVLLLQLYLYCSAQFCPRC